MDGKHNPQRCLRYQPCNTPTHTHPVLLEPPRVHRLTASRNNASLEALSVQAAKNIPSCSNGKWLLNVYKTWLRWGWRSQHMPERQPHHPEGVPETAAATATALGKKGQRPRTWKSFYPQHQSPLQPVWGILFLNIQKVEQIPSRGETEALPDGNPPGSQGTEALQRHRPYSTSHSCPTASGHNKTRGGRGASPWRVQGFGD